MSLRRRTQIILALAGVVALGFLREFLFVNINAHLFALWYDEPSEATDLIPFMKSMEYYPLYYSKWVLTVAFSALFYGMTWLTLKVIFKRSFAKELLAIYGALYLLAGIAMGIGVLYHKTDDSYIIARFLMGIAQSPLLLMIMVPGVWLRRG